MKFREFNQRAPMKKSLILLFLFLPAGCSRTPPPIAPAPVDRELTATRPITDAHRRTVGFLEEEVWISNELEGGRANDVWQEEENRFVVHLRPENAPVNNSADDAMGIPRLRMPSSAPSRSTLKLEEAIHWFFDDEKKYFKNGMTAVDLGAAPGGWSWQLVQRGLRVTAIDNGPMQDKLMQGGMVEHLKTDAFTYRPAKAVDWLVCDMAERPLHVSRLIAKWLVQQDCKNAIFNLKLPMKKRLLVVNECRDLIVQQLLEHHIDARIQIKHLYHDREEVTVCIMTS